MTDFGGFFCDHNLELECEKKTQKSFIPKSKTTSI